MTRNLICLHDKKTAQQMNINNFLVSSGWCTRFMKRNKLVLRQKTKISQRLPDDLEEKITSFQSFVIRARQSKNYSLVNIGNMDETPVWFDMPTSKTVDSVGAKTVLLKTTGHEKTRFTVVLACLADGTKLKPMVIFKRKTMPKDNFPAGVVVHNHPKGWMDESGVKIWIEKVWQARPGGFANTQSLLVWNSFSAHLTDTVKQQPRENKTATAVIPGSLTSLVQPLDVCLNKPFKDRLREKWMTWMMSGEKTFTPGGQLRAASLVTVCQWVKESWQELSKEMVERSFKKCGISNALDGTEDDLVWEEEEDSSQVEEEPDCNVYDNRITPEQRQELFGESDDEEFHGF